MKKPSILTILILFLIPPVLGQQFGKITNPSYKFVSNPGFINITEINSAIGFKDNSVTDSKYYFGFTNVFGYQIDKNFAGGIGIGLFIYDTRQLIPLFLYYKYNLYLKAASPFFYADAGVLMDPVSFLEESKVFINPGVGINRHIFSRFEANFSAGFMLQTRTSLRRIGYINFKLGITFRKNTYRMFKEKSDSA